MVCYLQYLFLGAVKKVVLQKCSLVCSNILSLLIYHTNMPMNVFIDGAPASLVHRPKKRVGSEIYFVVGFHVWWVACVNRGEI